MTTTNDKMLKKLVDTVGAALLGVSSEGRIVVANPAAARLFGYGSKELHTLLISDLLPAWGSEKFDIPNLSSDAEAVMRPVAGRHKTGGQLVLDAQITQTTRQADGLCYALVLRNIAAELKAEELNRNEVQRMVYAVQGAKIGIFELDMLKGTSVVSGAWRELMGVAPDEEIDTQAEWRARVHPEDLPHVERADRDCINGHSERSLTEYRIRAPCGSGWRWMESDAIANRRDRNGKATRLIGVQTDITDRKNAEQALRQSEQKFRLAMENAPIGQALVATDGRWLAVNAAMCAFLGYSEQELLAIDFQTITHPDDLAKDVDHVERLLNGEAQRYSMDKRYLQPDGQIVWGHLCVALVRDEHGNPVHFISQILDITEQRRLERMKRDFTTTVSHELRTPVTAMAAALDLIDPVTFDAMPDKARKLIAISRENCGHLRLLLDDILDFEKLSSEKMSINLVDTNVFDIVQRSISVTQPLAAEFDVEVLLTARDHALSCKADPARVQQVIINLLSNAAKFSHEAGLVQVGLLDEGAQVRISVADRGIGIPAEFHETIFQPFSQVDPSDIRERRGTGLGLSISKQLIERMGGEIGVKTSEHGGAEFWVTLPKQV
ncbi:MAG: PAS domain S-box protein [Pseudomonadota bacterium]